jgi:hypothetical protein
MSSRLSSERVGTSVGNDLHEGRVWRDLRLNGVETDGLDSEA